MCLACSVGLRVFVFGTDNEQFFGIISKFARGIFAHQNPKVYIADFSTNCQSAKAGNSVQLVEPN